MEHHVCQCRHCHPERFPPMERQGPHHFAVRWGDWRLYVAYEGRVIDDATEMLAGPDGWVIRDAGPRTHRCYCLGDICQVVQYGDVRVSSDRAALEGQAA